MVEYLDDTIIQNGLQLRRIREGSTYYWIPDPEKYGNKQQYSPFDLPVFYNPAMEINRDLSVLTVLAKIDLEKLAPEEISGMTYVEALAGTGIRGFRLIEEAAPIKVILNDINPDAYRIMQINLKERPPELQALLHIFNLDANLLLDLVSAWGRADFVDIDPFGTPAPFIDSAVRAIRSRGGILLLTATDTAPLVGKFRNAAYRKYGVVLSKTIYGKEIAVRALICSAIRSAAKYNVALKPLWGVSLQHFVKVAFVTLYGKKIVDKILERCGKKELETVKGTKETIGPIWLGEIYSEEFILSMKKNLETIELSKPSKKRLSIIMEEALKTNEIPFFINIELIASKLKKKTPKIKLIIEELEKRGYKASRTHFDPKAIKTNAPEEIVIDIVKKL